jgi:tetratricopeptide (TPR) repeat protein
VNPVFADFNAITESGQVRLNCRGSQDDLRARGLNPGDWAWLSDGELLVGGRIDTSPGDGMVAVPDWKTLVHLDEPYDATAVGRELMLLLRRPDLSIDELWQVFRLLVVFERIAPPSDPSQVRPGYFSFRRAATLLRLQELDLALIEIEEARRQGENHRNDDFLLLEILRQANLSRAIQAVDELASDPALDAKVLAECVHVLATHADQLTDEQFQTVARRILELADRFERAPGRDRVHASTLAVVQINRGLVQLRLGHLQEAQRSLDLASASDPTIPELLRARDLTSYDEQAREVASQYYRRAVAA